MNYSFTVPSQLSSVPARILNQQLIAYSITEVVAQQLYLGPWMLLAGPTLTPNLHTFTKSIFHVSSCSRGCNNINVFTGLELFLMCFGVSSQMDSVKFIPRFGFQ